ncbi:hypothetical protein PROFUN_11540 [Planoprotostelium fungivorum]|uniref:Uncharacterized protein n=1 Tax=Planoprotostelium fungivorum TaxID=1890364 RepID=A0A2P6NA32_9EUKA|nr:hypothetical protein PROFUN_11540 [Planoprotostelium fungivorum]
MRSSYLPALFILFIATHSAHADLLGGLLGSGSGGGLLGGKGIAVTASYATKVRVHANIAANIALDLPTTGGLLSPVTGLLGGVLSVGQLLGNLQSSSTVLTVKACVDLDVTVGVLAQADLNINLPTGCKFLGTNSLIGASVKVGITIDVSVSVAASVTLVTPVLNGIQGQIGIVKINADKTATPIPCVYDSNTGRLAADLSAYGVVGTYIFVQVFACLGSRPHSLRSMSVIWQKEAIPGFEPGFQGSEPRVLTATLYGLDLSASTVADLGSPPITRDSKRFEQELTEITTAEIFCRCNCSLCHRPALAVDKKFPVPSSRDPQEWRREYDTWCSLTHLGRLNSLKLSEEEEETPVLQSSKERMRQQKEGEGEYRTHETKRAGWRGQLIDRSRD